MDRLAAEIQDNLDALVGEYDRRLVEIPRYAAMPAETRQRAIRGALKRVAAALEAQDPRRFVEFIEAVAVERATQGFEIETVQRAVALMGEIVGPLLSTVEEGNFFWQAMLQTQASLSSLAIDQSQAARDRFRRMAETSRDGVTIIEAGQVVYVNNRLCEIVGYPRDQLVHMNSLDFAAPEEKERLTQIIHEVRQKGQPLEEIEFWAVRPDGSRCYLRNRYALLREGDEIVGRLVFTTDLTERRRAEEALRESEALFRSVVQNAQAGIFIVDDTYKFIYTNDELLRIVGYPREDVIGESFMKFLDDESKALVADRYVRRQRGEDVPSRYEFNVVRKDGEKRRVEISSTAIRDAKGRVRTLAQLLDVTERRQAEAQREAALEELREQQAFLRQVLDLNPNLIFVKDKESRFVLANQALAEVYGTTPEDIIGKSDVDFTDPDQAQQFHLDDLAVMDSLEERVIPDRPLTDAEGNLRWVQAIKRPLVDEDGVARHVLGVSTDITERKQLEEQIRDLLRRRGQQMRTSTEIAQEIAAAPALGELFDRVVTLIKERFGYYHAQLFRYEPAVDAVALVAGYGQAGQALQEEGHQLTMGRGVVGTAAATGQPMLATDVRQDPDWVPNPHLPETRGELAVPIKWRDQVLGILDVQSERAGALTEDDQILLEGLCGQIAIAIESTRLQQEMEESLHELERLYRAVSREGWASFQREERATGYLFDQRDVVRQDDPWVPGADLEEGASVSPRPESTPVVVAPLAVRGEVFGALGVQGDPEHPLSDEELDLLEAISEQVAQALESARLFDEEQRARQLLGLRVNELDCLNDIGRVIDETPSVSDFLQWLGKRLPQAMQYPELCLVAIDFEGRIYGDASALSSPYQMVQGLHVGGEATGKVCIAYTEAREFLDEESALLGDVARRVSGYVENRRLLQEVQRRAERERLARTITDRVRRGVDREAIMRIAVRDLGDMLGASKTVVRLGTREQLLGEGDGPPSRAGNETV